MAQTNFGALTTLQKKVWSAQVLSAGRDASFFLGEKGFMGSGLRDASKPVHYVDALTKTERGDRAVMPLVQDLLGDGVTGDNELEGNEEALATDTIELQIDQLRHGVKSKGRFSEQQTVIQFRAQARDKLAYWMGSKVDEMMFLVASGVAFTNKLDGSSRSASSQLPQLRFAGDVSAPSTNRKLFGGTATATNTLTSSDKMTWSLITKARAFAARRRIKPIRIKGMDHYLIVMSPEQARDLKQDSDYKTIVANAGKRGSNNELFTGAFCNIEGIVLYEHAKVPTTFGLSSGSKWGSAGTIDGSQAIMLGAQALGYAKVYDNEWTESDSTDYGNKSGIGYTCMFGMLKAVFKSIYDNNSSEDFSTVSIYTASAQT